MIRIKHLGLIKTQEEIEIMQTGGKMLSEALKKVLTKAKEGVSELELDSLFEKQVIQKGAKVAFKEIDNYPNSLCFSVNDIIVHGIPTDYRLKNGDIVGIDSGLIYKGLNVDMSQTISIGNVTPEIEKFLKIGEEALYKAIQEAKPGNRIGHISKTIQDIIESSGYSVVKQFIGHGIGKKLHEDPEVPGYLLEDQKIEETTELKQGMTIAIEVIYNMGKDGVRQGDDDWTYKTADGSLSGLFERTVAITKQEPLILTP